MQIPDWKSCWAYCARVCRDLCQAPAPQPREAPTSLELPLLPSGRLRRWQRIGLLLAALHGLELWRHGHSLASVLMLSGTALAAWLLQRAGRAAPTRPQRLLLAGDGRLFLRLQGGALVQATLESASLRLGRSVLLVLRCDNQRHRLLLGPDNLAPAELAALQRRLPRTAGG